MIMFGSASPATWIRVEPGRSPGRDAGLFVFCALVAAFMLLILGVAAWGSFVTCWPYGLSLSLRNYDFANLDPSGWQPCANAIRMAAMATCIVLCCAGFKLAHGVVAHVVSLRAGAWRRRDEG